MSLMISAVVLASALVFVIGSVVRAIRYARQPIHLRWELYPVPHEDPRRVRHGGSRYEEGDWWAKPGEFHLLGELRFMASEILFMKGLWEFNRPLWRRSFPFHFGLYLLAGTLGLALLAALLEVWVPARMEGALGLGLHWLSTGTGLVGAILALIGAGLLLHRRLTAEDLKPYTAPADIFNLCWFLVAIGCLLAGHLLKGPDDPGAVAILRAVLSGDPTVRIPGLLGVGLILSALLAAYIPFTHMSHFIAKYFTYHAIRWDDRPYRPGDRIEKKLAEYLAYRPTWSARHVGADGSKTWAEVATGSPAEGEKR
jgi:nitrate reductase gamma subunit